MRRPWFFNIVFHTNGRVLRMISDPFKTNMFLKSIYTLGITSMWRYIVFDFLFVYSFVISFVRVFVPTFYFSLLVGSKFLR